MKLQIQVNHNLKKLPGRRVSCSRWQRYSPRGAHRPWGGRSLQGNVMDDLYLSFWLWDLSLSVLELTSNVLASTAVVNHPHSDNSWVKYLLHFLLATIHFYLPPCHPGHNTIDIDSNRLAINSCKLRKINISVLQNSFTFKSYLICWKTSQSGESDIIRMVSLVKR